MRTTFIGLCLAGGAVVAAVLHGAATPRTAAVARPVILTGTGSTFIFPLASQWFAAYHRIHPQVSINYQSLGSGAGVRQLQAQTVDFGASDAPLTDAELRQMPVPVVQFPIIAGAVALAYHLPGLPVSYRLNLSGAVIAEIYRGGIRSWDDARIAADNRGVKLPHLPVVVVHRSDGSGTSFLFTSYLAALCPRWKTQIGAGKSVGWPTGLGAKGNEGVTELVRSLSGAIGYVELAYILQSGIPCAQVKNLSGRFVLPCVASTQAAVRGAEKALAHDLRAPIVNQPGPNAYPICGMTYVLLDRRPARPEQGQPLPELFRWCLGSGQAMAPALQYGPLPTAVARLAARCLNGPHLAKVAGS